MIGVSPATLRRWSDAGEIEAFTTPGGHRRFSRAAVLRLLPTDRRMRPSLRQLGETPERMSRIYHRELVRAPRWAPWTDTLDDGDRLALREHGHRIVGSLLEFFDSPDVAERSAALAAAEESAGVCGRVAGRIDLPIDATVATFLRFRMPFVRELARVARQRRLDTTEATGVLVTATEAFDRLLISTIRGREDASARASAQVATEIADR